jgi:long-chain acyl-CoA synthetase
MLTHDNFIFAMDSPAFDKFAQPGVVTLVTLPMNHIFGFVLMIWVTWKLHGTIILHEWFHAEPALKDIEKYKIAYVPLVPTMLLAILNHEDVDAYDLSCVKIWDVAAAPFPAGKISEVEQRLGGKIVHEYALTESTAVAASQMPDSICKPGSVGQPLPGMEIRIMLPDGGEAARGEWGEICLRGPGVMKGYLNRPEATKEALEGGWLHTGDIGYLDEDGHLYVTDRIKDMVLRGGENIYSVEVEDALYKHAAVAEAAVVGIPDEKYGEEVFAFVVLREGAEAGEAEILTECQKHIPGYKCPKKIAFETSLPKTGTGKILKREVRGKAREMMTSRMD